MEAFPLPPELAALRSLPPERLPDLARAIRDEITERVGETGGHLAPSLGAVELTFALHRSFDTPHDRIVWDVGHQAYVHKLLTGRRERLRTLRSSGGIAGYLKRTESEYDAFGAGHAGTSVSAALGMRLALDRTGSDRYVVAVIGDGALTAGMSFEALNHAGGIPSLARFIVVLNDNGMSISANVGALSARSAELRAGDTRNGTAEWFRSLGFEYLGPVDGHDCVALEAAFAAAKAAAGPVLIHALTIKGKGLPEAERDPLKYHGVSGRSARPGAAPSYSSVFASTVLELAANDPRIVAITAGMPTGTGLDVIARERPGTFIDTGISEQHAVTLAAGLAAEGMRPVVAIYSTFLQRAYDQVLHDVCIQELPVVFVLDRAGLVGNDGETHQGLFDLSVLRPIPNIVLMAPRDEVELRRMLVTALNHGGPVAIRFPRGSGSGRCEPPPLLPLAIGRAEIMKPGNDGLIVALGPVANRALEVATSLRSTDGIDVGVVDARFVKPLDRSLLLPLVAAAPWTVVIEDHTLAGGFGSALLELVQDARAEPSGPIIRLGAPDTFIRHGSIEEQHRWCSIDHESIIGVCRGLAARTFRVTSLAEAA